jgi:hypothetical protein
MLLYDELKVLVFSTCRKSSQVVAHLKLHYQQIQQASTRAPTQAASRLPPHSKPDRAWSGPRNWGGIILLARSFMRFSLAQIIACIDDTTHPIGCTHDIQ